MIPHPLATHMELASAFAAGFLHILMATGITVHILLNKHDTKSSVGWIGLAWLAPLAGGLLYIILGINRIKRKAVRLRRRNTQAVPPPGKSIAGMLRELKPEYAAFLRFGHAVLPQEFMFGNTITPLQNGDEAYPAMASEIKKARKEVLLASYIFTHDEAGLLIANALKTAALGGVRVRVLVDGMGIRYASPSIQNALDGVENLEFRQFLPPRIPFSLPFVNLRNHRKLLVIDGAAAITGGMNISGGNLLKKHGAHGIADITFRITGPVVDQLSRVFEDDWAFSGGKRFRPAAHAKTAQTQEDTVCRVIPDGPDNDPGRLEWIILGALACARESVTVATPYFLPSPSIMNALEVCAMRGIDTEIILPGKSNIFGMDWAMEANFDRLLKAGIKIYRTQPPFDHSKFTVVDGRWSLIGSANWDMRSLRLNFEANVECIGESFARKLLAVAQAKKQSARLLRPHHGERISVAHRLRNNAFRLLTPYY